MDVITKKTFHAHVNYINVLHTMSSSSSTMEKSTAYAIAGGVFVATAVAGALVALAAYEYGKKKGGNGGGDDDGNGDEDPREWVYFDGYYMPPGIKPITQITTDTEVENLIKHCDLTAKCKAFTIDGFLYDTVAPRSSWLQDKTMGLYVLSTELPSDM